MREFGVRTALDISFHLLPIALIVPDLFARSANRQKAAKSFDALECVGEVLDEMQSLLFLRLTVGDVARYYGSALDASVRTFDGGDGHRNVNSPAVLSQSNGFDAVYAPVVRDEIAKARNFRGAVARNEILNGLPDHLGSGISENPFGARIPAKDSAAKRVADDGVVARFNYGSEMGYGELRLALSLPFLRGAQLPVDGRHKARQVVLHHIIMGPCPHHFDGNLFADSSGYDDEGDFEILLLTECESFGPVEFGHRIVAENQVPGAGIQRRAHIGGVVNPLMKELEIIPFELQDDKESVVFGVINHEHIEQAEHILRHYIHRPLSSQPAADRMFFIGLLSQL